MKPTHILPPLLAAFAMTLAGADAAYGSGDTVETDFAHVLPDIPGKSFVAVEVAYAPGGASLPHRHARSAFIYAYVVSGRIVSQVAGQPERIYAAGESWHELPGAHHVVSRNASDSEPARLLAVFIVDTDDKNLTTLDEQKSRDE